MTTYTSSAAATTYPIQGGEAGNVKVAYGSILVPVAATPEAADTFEFVRLPAGAVVVDGVFYGGLLDDDGTPEIDLDIGWAANGVETADTDGFGNFGPTSFAAVADYKPEADWFRYPFGNALKDGPKAFTNETVLTATCVAVAESAAEATMTMVVRYVVP
jgi:hypothetical protein